MDILGLWPGLQENYRISQPHTWIRRLCRMQGSLEEWAVFCAFMAWSVNPCFSLPSFWGLASLSVHFLCTSHSLWKNLIRSFQCHCPCLDTVFTLASLTLAAWAQMPFPNSVRKGGPCGTSHHYLSILSMTGTIPGLSNKWHFANYFKMQVL